MYWAYFLHGLNCSHSPTLGFLPPDVIELSKTCVDVNPEYSDSLEASSFAVHLMFDAVKGKGRYGSGSAPTTTIEGSVLRGFNAFEAGLAEV